LHIDTCSYNNPGSPTPVHVPSRYENLKSRILVYLCHCFVCSFIEARPTCENMIQKCIKSRRPYFQHINSQKTLVLLTLEISIPTDTPKNTTGPVEGYIMHSEVMLVLVVTCGVCDFTVHSRSRATTVATPYHLWITGGLCFLTVGYDVS